MIKPRRALPFFSRHPWVFSGAISRLTGEPEPGAEVVVRTHSGEFIARGLFNPHSNIKVRLYSWDEDVPLDEDFWSARLDEALELRRRLAEHHGQADAQRMVFSEADGLSGLVVDRYRDFLLIQLTSLALASRQDTLVSLLREKLKPSGIWLRTEKGIRESEGLELTDGLIDGREPERPMFIEEQGIRYGIDVVQGQKTGHYLDQRDNRLAAAPWLRGRVLDLFCNTGGFGLAASVRGGAKSVLGVDVSEPTLALARANAELNGVANIMEFEKRKVFEALEAYHREGRRYDAVILDPPRMTRHRAGVAKALRGYHSLNQMAVNVLEPGGILVTCSCSGLVSRTDFEGMLAEVAQTTGRRIQVLEARGQSADHPVSAHCFESNYLKCYICRVV